MKSLFFIFLLLATFTSAKSLHSLESDSINKPIIVIVSMNNCKYCVKQKKVLKDSEIKSIIKKNFQFTEINMSYVSLPEKLQTRSSPTIFVLDEKGDVISKYSGYQTKDKLIKNLNNSLTEIKAINKIDSELNFR